ncbi:AAA family ATPase [Nonomuraea dietziae]|uniref:AAA family ATPase n=1 Tax=Nonomuraea dietziae TaxID=65515 RepID=UPI0033E49833
MRPHRLTLTAFGSFPGTETVDFDALAEAGLFLVHGPTGAGKTTLLDALCFALYGVVPGQRNSARSLRCDHAAPPVGPSVELEVTLRGRTLRIQRSPSWTRPKLRGTGFTEEKAKVIVSEQLRGQEWQGLTTRHDEAGDLIGQLLGMNADQFCQVAMLPQGDFARFLRADGDERRRLLERLFTVKVFTAAEAWLAEHRKRTWRESQEGRQEVEFTVKRLEEAAGETLLHALSSAASSSAVPVSAPVAGVVPAPRPEADGEAAPTQESDPLRWSGLLLEAARALVGQTTTAWSAAEATLREHRDRVEQATALADRQRRHAEATRLRRALDERAEERSDLLTILDEATRADRVLPLITAARQRAETAGKARALAADALARARPLLSGPAGFEGFSRPLPGRQSGPFGSSGSVGPRGLEGVDLGMLAEMERERLSEISKIAELLVDETRLAQLHRDRRAAEHEIATLSSRERAIASRLEVLPGLVRSADEAAAQARLDAARIPAAEAALASATARLQAIERRDRLTAELATAHTEMVTRLRAAAPLSPALAALTPPLAPLPSSATSPFTESARPGSGSSASPPSAPGSDPGTLSPESPSPGALPPGSGYSGSLPSASGSPASGVLEGGSAVRGLLERRQGDGPLGGAQGADPVGDIRAGRLWRAVKEEARRVERTVGDQLATLEGLRADELRLAELDERLAVLEAELSALAERELAARAAADDLPAALHEVAGQLAEARAAAGRLPSATAACDAAASGLATAGRRQELEEEAEAARDAYGAAVETAQALRDHLQEIRQARIEGMAAELAAQLSDGAPCAVCGSPDHPAPAAPAPIAYAADDESEAQAAYDTALAERQSADSVLSSLSSRLDELADAPTVAEAEAELAALSDELEALTALASQEEGLERAAQRLESELEQALDQLHDTERRLTEARTAREGLAGERARVLARLDEARGEDASLSARRERLGGEIISLAELAESAERVGEIAARLDDALTALASLLTSAPGPHTSRPPNPTTGTRTDSASDAGASRSRADRAEGETGRGWTVSVERGAGVDEVPVEGAGEWAASTADGVGVVPVEGAPGMGRGWAVSAEDGADVHATLAESARDGVEGDGAWGEPMDRAEAGDTSDQRPGGNAAVGKTCSEPDGDAEAGGTWAAASVEAVRVDREWAEGVRVVAERELARLRRAADTYPGLAGSAGELADEQVRLGAAFRELGVALAACRTRVEELGAEAERLAERIRVARGQDATLVARLERLKEEAQLLREAHEATQAAMSAAAEHRDAVQAAEEAARQAGFLDAGDVLPAVRTQEEKEEKAERLRELDARHAAVTRTLADPELVAAAAQPPQDLAALEAEREQAEREHTALASARDRAERRVSRLAELHEELTACLGRWQPAADRHRLAERLAALASGTSGDNQWSMSLSSYVLGERLRQVVDAANERLDHMSGGRYQLQHDLRKTAGARGRAGGGLGLRVLDGWTGVDRDPATLSGGESFITSLALALGLADVVTAEAGGAEIGTLFVDEGFGTLDEDTLDGVLDILDGLRDGGRAVGIVSHVAELRTRIPAQLRVAKTRKGSTLSVITG